MPRRLLRNFLLAAIAVPAAPAMAQVPIQPIPDQLRDRVAAPTDFTSAQGDPIPLDAGGSVPGSTTQLSPFARPRGGSVTTTPIPELRGYQRVSIRRSDGSLYAEGELSPDGQYGDLGGSVRTQSR